MHVIGFWHQHNTPNRDKHVNIVKENVYPAYMNYFHLNDNEKDTDYGIGYDYQSIMHPDDDAFSINGKKTIVPKVLLFIFFVNNQVMMQ